MPSRLLLVSSDNNARPHYIEALSKLSVDFDVVDSLSAMNEAVHKTAYSGILIDVVTMVKCPLDDKEKAQRPLEMFPVARLKWDESQQQIRALLYGQVPQEDSLSYFIAEQCHKFEPRVVRDSQRLALHFNVLLGLDQDVWENPVERSVTVNAASGGCFVYTVSERWQVHDMLWLGITELEDKTPIGIEIRWRAVWGQRMRYPGLGVSFIQITQAQLDQLHRMLSA